MGTKDPQPIPFGSSSPPRRALCVFSSQPPPSLLVHRSGAGLMLPSAVLGAQLFHRGCGTVPWGARAPKQGAGLAQGWIPLERHGVLVMPWLRDSPSSSSSSFLFLLILLLGIPAGISCVVIAAVQPPKLHTAAGQGGKGTSPCPCARSQGCVAPCRAGQPVLALVWPWLLSPSHQGSMVPRPGTSWQNIQGFW